MSATSYYIGVDVGTGSTRACLVDKQGKTIASSTRDIQTFRDHADHRIFEQSTTDIWSSISKVVRTVVESSGIAPLDVKGIGFDATCSLAVTDEGGQPVVITSGSELGQIGERNIILWADHRAEAEAELINQTGSLVLDYVGGTMSVCPVAFRHSPDTDQLRSWKWKCRRFYGSSAICPLLSSPAANSSTSQIISRIEQPLMQHDHAAR